MRQACNLLLVHQSPSILRAVIVLRTHRHWSLAPALDEPAGLQRQQSLGEMVHRAISVKQRRTTDKRCQFRSNSAARVPILDHVLTSMSSLIVWTEPSQSTTCTMPG